MSSNVEKFIIELGFEDKEALKGLKSFLKKMNDINKAVVSSSNQVKEKIVKNNQAQQTSTSKTNDLLAAQIRLRNTINRATKLGIDTKADEKSLSRAKKANTLLEREKKLRDEISKVSLANTKAKLKTKPDETLKQEAKEDKRLLKQDAKEDKRYQNWFKNADERDKQSRKAYEEGLKQSKALASQDISNAKAVAKANVEAEEERYQNWFKNANERDKQSRELYAQGLMQSKALGSKDVFKAKAAAKANVEEDKRYQDWFKNAANRDKKESELYAKNKKLVKQNTDEIIKQAKKVASEIESLDKEAFNRKKHYHDQLQRLYNQQRFQRVEQARPDFAASVRRQGNELLAMAGQKNLTGDEILKLNESMRNLQGSVNRTAAAVGRQTRAMIGLQTVQLGLRDSTRNLIRSYASMFAVISGGMAINTAGQGFESMRAGMNLTGESAKDVESNLSFVREEAKRLGLDLLETSKGFMRLTAAGRRTLSQEEIRQIFTGVAEAGTVLQLSVDDMNGSIKALGQMLSKGQIYAEEFRSQLLERMPIAMEAMEIATGKTAAEISKLMEQGKLGPDVLPAFGKALSDLSRRNDALGKSMATVRVEQARFKTAMQASADVIFSSGFGEGLRDLFKTITQETDDGRMALEGLGQIFKWLFKTIALAVKIVSPVIDSFLFVVGKIFEMINKLNDVVGNNFYTSLLIAAGGMKLFSLGLAKVGVAGKVVNGVLASMRALIRSLFFQVLLVIAALDELFALFVKDRVGLLELAIGKDIHLDNMADIGKQLGKSFVDGMLSAFNPMNWSKDKGYLNFSPSGVVSTGIREMFKNNSAPLPVNNTTSKTLSAPNVVNANLTVQVNGNATEEGVRQLTEMVNNQMIEFWNKETSGAQIVGVR